MIDTKKIRRDFPILKRKINGKPLAYLDSAATSQKPKQVIDAIKKYWEYSNANVHRAIHTLTVEATDKYDESRKKIADFIGVKDSAEIIFVRNTSEAINLVAYSWGRVNISRGDEIVTTIVEHHSNFVPWQQLAIENGAVLKVVPIDKNSEIDEVAFKKALTKKTKLVTFFHVSNVLGTINDVDNLSTIVHRRSPKAKVLIDGAQAVPHLPVNISKIGCDFYAFSGHKMLGPAGIGVLWGKKEILQAMPPFLFGGEMISSVKLGRTTWADLPLKFEAGTPNIEGAIGLAAAVDYLQRIGMKNVRQHEIELTRYAIKKLLEIPQVTIYGLGGSFTPGVKSGRRQENTSGVISRAGVISFKVGNPSMNSGQDIPAHDIASILDSEGVEVRSGYNCAEPLADFLGTGPLARASFYIYNNEADVDRLVEGILKVKETFRINSKSEILNSKQIQNHKNLSYQRV